MKDYRKNQKVIIMLALEDRGQDFLELDILQNGVLLGNSIMFKNGRLSLLGIGMEDGIDYYTASEIIESDVSKLRFKLNGLTIYLKDTDKKDPLPWKADILNYKVVGVKKAVKPNRFIK